MGKGNIEGPKTAENSEVSKVNASENVNVLGEKPIDKNAGDKLKIKIENEKKAMTEKEGLTTKIPELIKTNEATWKNMDTFFLKTDGGELENRMKNAVADYIANKLSDTEKNKDNPISATYHSLENKKDNLEIDRLFYQKINIETIKNNINKEHVREEFQKIIPGAKEEDINTLLYIQDSNQTEKPGDGTYDSTKFATKAMYILNNKSEYAPEKFQEVLKTVWDSFEKNGKKTPLMDIDPRELMVELNSANQANFDKLGVKDKGDETVIDKTFSMYTKDSYNVASNSDFDNSMKKIIVENKNPKPGIVNKEVQVIVSPTMANDAMFKDTMSKYINNPTIKIKIVNNEDIIAPMIREVRDEVETKKETKKIVFEHFEPNVIDNAATKVVGDQINDLIKNPDAITKRKIDKADITGSASHNPTNYTPKYIAYPKNMQDITPNIDDLKKKNLPSINNINLAKDRAMEMYSKLPEGTNTTIKYKVDGPIPDDPKIIGAKNEEEKLAIYKDFQNSTLDISYTDTKTTKQSQDHLMGLGFGIPKKIPFYKELHVSMLYGEKSGIGQLKTVGEKFNETKELTKLSK